MLKGSFKVFQFLGRNGLFFPHRSLFSSKPRYYRGEVAAWSQNNQLGIPSPLPSPRGEWLLGLCWKPALAQPPKLRQTTSPVFCAVIKICWAVSFFFFFFCSSLIGNAQLIGIWWLAEKEAWALKTFLPEGQVGWEIPLAVCGSRKANFRLKTVHPASKLLATTLGGIWTMSLLGFTIFLKYQWYLILFCWIFMNDLWIWICPKSRSSYFYGFEEKLSVVSCCRLQNTGPDALWMEINLTSLSRSKSDPSCHSLIPSKTRGTRVLVMFMQRNTNHASGAKLG